MEYSYNSNGLREGVVFIFVDEDKVLIEHRPSKTKDVFFPNGSIEISDHTDQADYKLFALKREIHEEFSGKIEPKEIYYLGETAVPEINIVFYSYVIQSWQGTFPEYTVEEDKEYAKLEWIPLEQYKNHFIYPAAFKISEDTLSFLKGK